MNTRTEVRKTEHFINIMSMQWQLSSFSATRVQWLCIWNKILSGGYVLLLKYKFSVIASYFFDLPTNEYVFSFVLFRDCKFFRNTILLVLAVLFFQDYHINSLNWMCLVMESLFFFFMNIPIMHELSSEKWDARQLKLFMFFF